MGQGHVTPYPKERIHLELWRWKIEYDPWCIHVRFPHVSFHRIIRVDLGDACTRQLNWSFTQVSAASTRVASVTGQCHVCNGGILPFFLLQRPESACHHIFSSSKRKKWYKKLDPSTCSTRNDSKSSKVSGTTAPTESVE